jgi:hypothetical protein
MLEILSTTKESINLVGVDEEPLHKLPDKIG